MKNFKNLIVWQRGMQLVKAVTQVIEELPKSEKYTYRDQIMRSSISIPSNIAEGCSRESRKDFKRFLRISLGSSFELETQLLLLQENKVIETVGLEIALNLNAETQKMLHALLKK